MSTKSKPFKTSQEVLDWMFHGRMLVKGTRKDPETFAAVQGFLLSEDVRERIGAHLVELVANATRRKKTAGVTLRDAFLTATIATLLEKTQRSLTEDELTNCANIIFALLPIERLEQAGLADRPLRLLASEKWLVDKLQRVLHH